MFFFFLFRNSEFERHDDAVPCVRCEKMHMSIECLGVVVREGIVYRKSYKRACPSVCWLDGRPCVWSVC